MTDTAVPLTTKKDWTSDQEVRWCPGCGDYGILLAVQQLMPELGVAPENTVFVSGIGCSSRFPYYMNTYGMHSIHGRAPAIATGVAVARPDLDVWVITGDGDGLSIGGNHLIHALRRNVNLTILLFNNRIYGLTKGQYSPTSELGKVTKSTPIGSVDPPFNPLAVALGAEASFVARTHDLDRKHMMETFRAAHDHRGASFVEIYQNCNVFNDGQFNEITKKQARDEMMIDLVHGEPIRFGADRQRGVVMGTDGQLRLVEVADVGEDAILVHDAERADPSLAFALARLSTDDHSPTPFGVFRDVERQEYASAISNQLAQASERKGPGDLRRCCAPTARGASPARIDRRRGRTATPARIPIPSRGRRRRGWVRCRRRVAARQVPFVATTPEADERSRAPSQTVRCRGRRAPTRPASPCRSSSCHGRRARWPCSPSVPLATRRRHRAAASRRRRRRRPGWPRRRARRRPTRSAADAAPADDLARPSPATARSRPPAWRSATAAPTCSASQQGLVTAGFLDGAVTGQFDQATYAAVETLQKERELFVDGIVGRETAISVGVWPDEASLVVRTPPPAAGRRGLVGLPAVVGRRRSAPTPRRVPADSGSGRRVVYERAGQRVWAIDDDEQVIRSWLVSGSKYGNEQPGLPRGLQPLGAVDGVERPGHPAADDPLPEDRHRRHRLPRHPAPRLRRHGLPDRGRARHPAVGRLPAPGQPRRRVHVGLRPGRHDRRRHLTPDALRAAAPRRRPDGHRRRRPAGRGARLRRRPRRRPRRQRLEPAADAWQPRRTRRERIRVGTFVLNAGLHHPLMLAREVATLDRLSGGRVELGLGAGHTPAEFAAVGVPFARRARAQGAPRRVRRDRARACSTARHGRPPRRALRPRRGVDRTGVACSVRCRSWSAAAARDLLTHAARHADIVGFTGLGRTLADGHRHAVRFQPDVARRRGRRRRRRRPPGGPSSSTCSSRSSTSPTIARPRPRGWPIDVEGLTVGRRPGHAVPRPRHPRRDRRPPAPGDGPLGHRLLRRARRRAVRTGDRPPALNRATRTSPDPAGRATSRGPGDQLVGGHRLVSPVVTGRDVPADHGSVGASSSSSPHPAKAVTASAATAIPANGFLRIV